MNVDKMKAHFICLLRVIVSIFHYSVRQGLAQRHSELIIHIQKPKIRAELHMSVTHEDHMRRKAWIVVKGLLQHWFDAAKLWQQTGSKANHSRKRPNIVERIFTSPAAL